MLRRERRAPSELELPEPYPPPERSPEATAICVQHEARLHEALGELPAMQREAVRAAFLDGLLHSEAHQALGSRGTPTSRELPRHVASLGWEHMGLIGGCV